MTISSSWLSSARLLPFGQVVASASPTSSASVLTGSNNTRRANTLAANTLSVLPHFGKKTKKYTPKPPKAITPPLAQSLIDKGQGLIDALKTLSTLATEGEAHEQFVRIREALGELGEVLGFHKALRVPRMLVTDAYTAGSERIVHKDAKDYSSYHIAFRRAQTPWMKDMGLTPEQSRYVFFGLQQIMTQFLQDPVTRQEIDAADAYFKTARMGGPFQWDRWIWDRVVDENNGIIPIKIEALPDGDVVFPGEPVMQISAQDGFGELAAWFETTLLKVWATSERASLLRHWLEYNKNMVTACTNQPLSDKEVTTKAQRMFADFSDRSSINDEESQMLGLASMLSFPTTSTVSAGYRAYIESAHGKSDIQAITNLSMDSLSHRAVQSYDDEGDVYKKHAKNTRGSNGSFVADCYDYERAVKEYLLPLALEAKEDFEKTGVRSTIWVRPDSGDYIDVVLFALRLADKAGLSETVTAQDGRKLKAMTFMKVVQADGMSFPQYKKLCDALLAAGFSPPDCLAVGVGGYLHNQISRDNLSAAQKLAAKGSRQKAVRKSPVEAPGKGSIPGNVKIVRTHSGDPSVRSLKEPGENRFKVYYDGIAKNGIQYREDYAVVQQHVLNDFNEFPKPKQIFSSAIRRRIQRLDAKYHGPYKFRHQKEAKHA